MQEKKYQAFLSQEAIKDGEELKDYTSTGRERPWREKRLATEQLANIYAYVNPSKAERLRKCATFLTFSKKQGKLKLYRGNFCCVRLCPMCQWRRACKVQTQMRRILDEIARRGEEYAYIFLTLTVRNAPADELSETLNAMQEGWHRMANLPAFKKAVKGTFRATEITHDTQKIVTKKMLTPSRKGRPTKWMLKGCKLGDKNPTFDTYHPHYHVILAVNKSYFDGRTYIPHLLWQAMWKQSIRADYAPVVDIRRIKGNTVKSIVEAGKYTVKESDLMSGDISADVKTVAVLDKALNKRRFASFSGIFKQIQKDLNLSDLDDPNGEQDQISPETEAQISYIWVTGVNKYLFSPYV